MRRTAGSARICTSYSFMHIWCSEPMFDIYQRLIGTARRKHHEQVRSAAPILTAIAVSRGKCEHDRGLRWFCPLPSGSPLLVWQCVR